MSSAYCPLLTVVLLQSSRQCSLGDYGTRGLLLVFLLYDITWLIEEMPYDNVDSFCLAVPWYYVLGEGSR